MLMLVVGLIAGGALAIFRMRVDIFPPFDLPQIYVIQNYNGMSPAQMEGLIVNQFELNFQYVDGVKNVESKSIQQIALIKLSFYPGTDMAQAMAEVVGQANRAQAFMPPGVLPPQIMRMDAGSFPVGYLVLTSQSETLGALADYAQQRIRPLLQTQVPGTVGTSPFGSNVRLIVVKVDPQRLRSYNLTPADIVTALTQGNVVTPAGNLYVKDQMPLVPIDAMISKIADFGKIPVRQGRNVYIRDVATVEDGTDINFGYALVDGRRSIYVPVVKHNTASTLTVVADIHRALPIFSNALPESVKISYEFDESPTVKESIRSVAIEGLIGATLTGLMILLFLHDWRSVVVVVFNIPMALLSSLCALWITGGTINIMTLGGLALSIGMLVDEATVSIENIHVQMGHTGSLARAVERGSNETAVPRLLAMLCILSVFIPAFIMAEPVRSLFVPLALAVGFAMIASYILSSTVVPVLSVWLLKHHGHRSDEASSAATRKPSLFDRFQSRFGRAAGWVVAWRWIVTPVYLATCLLVLVVVGLQLGTELFPQVDSGEFVLRFRAPPGTNFELTRQMWVRCLQVIDEEAGAGHVHISMGFAGQQAPNYGVNNMILFMRGPDDGQMRVQLTDSSGVAVGPLRERLRKVLPERIVPWFAEVLEHEGYSAANAQERARQIVFGFEPGDVVSKVMSFGSPTPIEVIVASPDFDQARAHAEKIEQEFRTISSLRDVQIQQTLNYPTVPITIDRQKAGLSGLTTKQVGDSVLVATSSSRMVARNYWQDPRSGVSYQVEVLGADPADELAGRGRNDSARRSRPGPEPDGPRRGSGRQRRDARRVRSHRHAALSQRHRQHRGRRPGPSLETDRPRTDTRGRAAARRARANPRSDRPDARNVPIAGDRSADRGAGNLRDADRLFSVAAPGPGLAGRRAGRAQRSGAHVVHHAHHAEHRIVHGNDYVHRCFGFQFGDAGHLHCPRLAARPFGDRCRRARGEREIAAHSDDGLCHDRWHGTDVAGLGKGKPNGGSAGPRGDWRIAGFHLRHAAHAAADLCDRHRHPQTSNSFSASGRQEKRPL